MRYILDTNILLFYIRNSEQSRAIQQKFNPFAHDNEAILSIVTVGEIKVFANIHNWGAGKLQTLQSMIDNSIIVDLNYQSILDNYVEIELFNRKNHPVRSRIGSHIKMGKNDVWIAATAMSTNAILLTADQDFAHLKDTFLDVEIV